LNRPVIVVHGGAWFIPDRLLDVYREGCRRAALVGWDVLQKGGSALDAVEAAVRVMEDDPTYDAGRGSNANRDGDVEMDAIIMDGRTLNLGAVAAVRQIQNPISFARKVMKLGEHNFIVASGAERLARELGIPSCDPASLMAKRANPDSDESWSPPGCPSGPADTVGAVALDLHGDLAVATSTGGTPDKRPGRVGDSPLVGSGAYADNDLGAASATGWGERLMRIVASKTACDYLRQVSTPQEAAEAMIKLLETRVAGYGGVIMVDPEGRIGLAHNTPNMSFAYVLPGQEVVAGTKL